jgi:hypothetical protein
MGNGYEQTYEIIRSRLVGCDFADIARRMGLNFISEELLSVDFLGRTYEITRAGVHPADGKGVNVNILSVLVYYAVSPGKGEPLYDFTLMHNFSRGLFSGSHSEKDWMGAPLVREFSGDYKKFARVADALGMVYEGSRTAGEYTWDYLLLPRMPVKVVYYEADDEFPCEVKIFYDKTAPGFLEFEPLAVLNGCFISALVSAGRCPENAAASSRLKSHFRHIFVL